jgi:hypothetical protein
MNSAVTLRAQIEQLKIERKIERKKTSQTIEELKRFVWKFLINILK